MEHRLVNAPLKREATEESGGDGEPLDGLDVPGAPDAKPQHRKAKERRHNEVNLGAVARRNRRKDGLTPIPSAAWRSSLFRVFVLMSHTKEQYILKKQNRKRSQPPREPVRLGRVAFAPTAMRRADFPSGRPCFAAHPARGARDAVRTVRMRSRQLECAGKMLDP